MQPNSWEIVFARAGRRCAGAGYPVRVSPHQLRHTFAVHMLAMLIQHRLRDAGDGKTQDWQGEVIAINPDGTITVQEWCEDNWDKIYDVDPDCFDGAVRNVVGIFVARSPARKGI